MIKQFYFKQFNLASVNKDGYKYYNVSQTSLIRLQTVEWSNSSILNNSI